MNTLRESIGPAPDRMQYEVIDAITQLAAQLLLLMLRGDEHPSLTCVEIAGERWEVGVHRTG